MGGHGLRNGTRYAFSRDFRKKGMIRLSTYLTQFKVGDIVDIVNNGAAPSLPHRGFHGKTGIIFNVTKSAVGVMVNKQVGNRIMVKRVNVRIEHIRKSKSRDEFLHRVKDNAAKRRKAKTENIHIHLKRIPAMPREARTVSTKDNKPMSLAPIAYDTTI